MPKYYSYKAAGYFLYFTSKCIVEAFHVHASDGRLTEHGSAKDVIAGARNTDDLLLRISALSDKELVPGRTLVFFDEIQEFEDILTWAKFLGERSDYDYVFSGSLLGVDLFGIRSWPVGFLDELTMFPLTFEEFARACGTADSVIGVARECVDRREAVPSFVHDKLMELHARYLLVGGLPEPLQRYLDTNDMVALRRAHKGVFDLYEHDIARHMRDNEGIRFTQAVYEAIPGQLNKENKRFKYSGLAQGGRVHKGDLRFSRMESSFDWLGAAGVALPTLRLDEPRFPLGLYENRASFKLYLNASDCSCLAFRGRRPWRCSLAGATSTTGARTRTTSPRSCSRADTSCSTTRTPSAARSTS